MKPDREGESNSKTEWRWSKRGASESKPLWWCPSTKRSAVGAAEANQAGVNRGWSRQNKIHPVFFFFAPAELLRQQQLFLGFQITSDGFSVMDIPTCFRTPVQRHLLQFILLFFVPVLHCSCFKCSEQLVVKVILWGISTPSTHDCNTLTPTLWFVFQTHMNTEKLITAIS